MGNSINIPWPDWKIVQILGRGAFGTVYEIQKDVFGKKESAALKVLSIPESQDEIDDLYSKGYDDVSISAHFKGYLEDIVSEYSIMLDLKSHSNVVYCEEVRYIQHEDGIGWDVFIKMELLKSLNKAIGNEYIEDEVIRLGKDLCSALIYCNQKRIIHRDIKPQNIFVSESGSYKLGDFGVAKVSDKTMSGTKIGTYEYMAPEVYKVQQYGSRVDIYSLGLVMYWMMNQKCTPFLPLPPQIPTAQQKESARNRRLDGERLPAPVNGSEQLKAIVLKACAYDPRDRYSSAQDMLNALINMNAGNPGPIPEPVDLDVHKEMTFEHSNHPAGKYLSIQVDAREVHFSVPMDIKDGQTIQLRGKGKYDGSTGTSGDLYITVHIKAATDQQNSSNNKFIHLAIATVAVILAVILFIPKNKTSTTPPVDNTPQTPQVSIQEEKPKETTPPVNNTPQTPQVSIQEEKPKETTPPATQHVHTWKDATYSDPKTCTTCGATEGSRLVAEPIYLNELGVSYHEGKVWTRGKNAPSGSYHTNSDARSNSPNVPTCWGNWSTPGYTPGIVKDQVGNEYTYGIFIDGKDSQAYYMEFNLDGKYTTFSGTCACPDRDSAVSSYVYYNASTLYSKYFEVYLDGEYLGSSPSMRADYSPQKFEFDVTGGKTLRILYPKTGGANEIASIYDGMLS